MLRLKQLKVKGTRGIVDGPDLYFETGGLLLCGDNGTGKSSYIDALEKVLTDKCSSLDSVGQGISWNKQGANIQSKKPDIQLVLTDGTKDIILSLDTAHDKLDKHTQAFLEAACQQSFILRRRTLLDFIDAEPRKRYQAIEGFLNLDEFTSFETSLKDLLADVDARLVASKDNKKQRERTLRIQVKMNSSVPVNDQNCLQSVNEVLGVVQVATLTTLDDIPATLTTLEDLLAPFKDMDVFQKVQSLVDKVREIPIATEILNASLVYTQACHAYADEESRLKGHFYAEVLKTGLAWIKEDALEQCPLCDNPIEVDRVTAYVNNRLAENKHLTQLRDSASRAQTAFVNALKLHRDALKRVKNQWQDAIGSEFPAEASQIINHIEHMVETHSVLLTWDVVEHDATKLAEVHFDEVTQVLGTIAKSKRKDFPDNVRYL